MCSGYKFLVRCKDHKYLSRSTGMLLLPLHDRLKFLYVMPRLEGFGCNVTLVKPSLTTPHPCYFHCCVPSWYILFCNYLFVIIVCYHS